MRGTTLGWGGGTCPTVSLTVVTHNTYIRPYLCIFSQIEFCICKSLCVCLKVEVFFAKQIVFICKTLDFFDAYKLHTKLTIYVLTLYGPIVERDLCAHTILVKYSGCACAEDDTVYGQQPEIT